jgi:hypothetical protein
VRAAFLLLGLRDNSAKVNRADDSDSLKRLEASQVAVAGDDEVGFALYRALEDAIVIGIVRDRFYRPAWTDQFRDMGDGFQHS